MVSIKNKNKKTIYLNSKSRKILFIISKVRNNQAWFSKWINRKLIDEFNDIDMTNDYFKLSMAEFYEQEEHLKNIYDKEIKEIQRLRMEAVEKFNKKEKKESSTKKEKKVPAVKMFGELPKEEKQ